MDNDAAGGHAPLLPAPVYEPTTGNTRKPSEDPSDVAAKPPSPSESRRRSTYENMKTAFVFVLFVVLRAMDRVFNKRVQDRMVNYQLMYMNVL